MNKTERLSAKLGNASGVTSVQTGSLARSQMAIAVQAEKGKYVPRTLTISARASGDDKSPKLVSPNQAPNETRAKKEHNDY